MSCPNNSVKLEKNYGGNSGKKTFELTDVKIMIEGFMFDIEYRWGEALCKLVKQDKYTVVR